MSNVAENPALEVVPEEEVMSKEDVLNFLIATGVNNCNRSYENPHKEMRNLFINMSLSEIPPTWDHLDDAVKVAVINAHIDEFKTWVSNG